MFAYPSVILEIKESALAAVAAAITSSNVAPGQGKNKKTDKPIFLALLSN